MRIIKYYDRINKKYVDLEVNDEVALFLMSNDKWLRRKQNQFNYYNISIYTPIYDNEDDGITLADTLKDEEETMNCRTCKQRLRFFNLVWKVASKLDKKQYDLIWDIFVEKKSQKQLAEEMHTTDSNISQLKSTALTHLAYHLYTDKDFMQTDLYIRNKREFEADYIKIAKEIDNEKGLTFNLNNILDLVKGNTQMLKSISSLGIELDEKQKDLLTFMNRTVKQTLEKLNVDWTNINTLTIPHDVEITEELKRKLN